MFPFEEVVALPLTKRAFEIETLVVEALPSVVNPVMFAVPETVREERVPTEVRAEEVMLAPSDVASKTLTLLIRKHHLWRG